MNRIEICINGDDKKELTNNIKIALAGGAERIELCSAMQHQGLTPAVDAIKCAAKIFSGRTGLMVMIRPRMGDFCYSKKELLVMLEQIKMAASAGADGVVFGVLKSSNAQLDFDAMTYLINMCQSLYLEVTFHRAFDVIENKKYGIAQLIELGVDRVLTSGTPWGSNLGAIDGIEQLTKTIQQGNSKIEVVICGGINPYNIAVILNRLGQTRNKLSLHAYSGAQKNAVTDLHAIKMMVNKG